MRKIKIKINIFFVDKVIHWLGVVIGFELGYKSYRIISNTERSYLSS